MKYLLTELPETISIAGKELSGSEILDHTITHIVSADVVEHFQFCAIFIHQPGVEILRVCIRSLWEW